MRTTVVGMMTIAATVAPSFFVLAVVGILTVWLLSYAVMSS